MLSFLLKKYPAIASDF